MKFTTMKWVLTALVTVAVMNVNTVSAQNCSKGGETSTRTYSLYKEYYKQGNYEKALPYWREIFNTAPGLFKGAFIDGAEMFSTLVYQTENNELKQKYIDTLMMIYDKRIECWGDKGYVLSRKAMDLAKYRPNEIQKVKSLLEEALALDKEKTKYYAITTYLKVLINLKDEPGGVNADYIKSKYTDLVAYCDANIQANDEEKENFIEAKKEMEALMKEYVLPKRFAPGSPWNSGTLTAVQKTDSLMKWMSEDMSKGNLEELYLQVKRDATIKDSTIRYMIEDKLLTIAPSADKANNVGFWYYDSKKFNEAIPYFRKAVELSADPKEKAKFTMSIADTYRQLNLFTESREEARKAIGFDSTSAKPYYMIGILYLSSGKLCGPGTGFDSQRVLWPAFDYLEKAKNMDATLAETIDGLLVEYKKYLPDRAAIAQKGLKVGGSYLVPCWIQEEGLIRSKD